MVLVSFILCIIFLVLIFITSYVYHKRKYTGKSTSIKEIAKALLVLIPGGMSSDDKSKPIYFQGCNKLYKNGNVGHCGNCIEESYCIWKGKFEIKYK